MARGGVGFFDHVSPTVAVCGNGRVLGRGYRLPLLILSPYAKKGAGGHGLVYSKVTEQASIPRLVASCPACRSSRRAIPTRCP